MAGRLAPIPGAPALLVRSAGSAAPSLIVADLHLGLGASRERPAGPPESSGPGLAGDLVRLARAARAARVVVAGDVKHPIVGTPPALRPVIFDFFSELLRAGLDVIVVLGNHDVGLMRHLPREVAVHPPTGLVLDDVGVFHGHCWPSNRVLRARRLVAGHLHPGFRLAPSPDEPEGKRRCWLRLEFPPPTPVPRRRRRHGPIAARELVVLPAFNPITGTEALNRARPSRGRSFLYARFLSRGVVRAYLLDGTDLGTLTLPRSAAPPR
jgi:metallophosphoesterase superfamily enzyme